MQDVYPICHMKEARCARKAAPELFNPYNARTIMTDIPTDNGRLTGLVAELWTEHRPYLFGNGSSDIGVEDIANFDVKIV